MGLSMNILFAIRIVLALTFLVIVQTKPVYAYLDPGTGSLILQSLLAFVAGALVFFQAFKNKIRAIFNSKRRRKLGEEGISPDGTNPKTE